MPSQQGQVVEVKPQADIYTLLIIVAIVGLAVTIISLVLTNFVSPQMAKHGEQAVMKNIANREGNLGEVAIYGVKHLSEVIGKGSDAFAIHSKGHEYAAHNMHANPDRPVCYTTSNRGACHRNRSDATSQNVRVMEDCTTLCAFGTRRFGSMDVSMNDLLQSITGNTWNDEIYEQAGERIFNLEKCFNYREGFNRADDEWIPARFFTEPLSVGPFTGAVVDRDAFIESLNSLYTERGWDLKTSKPSREKLASLGLEFAWDGIANM